MNKQDLFKICLFISVTFILSWGFDYLCIKLWTKDAHNVLTPGMLTPALVAILIQHFSTKGRRVVKKDFSGKSSWLFYAFILLYLSLIILNILANIHNNISFLFSGIGTVFISLWTLLVFIIQSITKREDLKKVGLDLGNLKAGFIFILGVLVFFLIQALLNLAFNLAEIQPQSTMIYGIPASDNLYIPILLVLFIAVALIGGPLSSLALYFGEEFGWRGFLQNKLFKYNKIFGAFLVGAIWGIWHIPIILRGVHTYPPTLIGIVCGLVFFTLWGFIQSYSVIKTGSIWVAAFMHGSVNYIYSFSIQYICKPENNLISFGLGIYGLLTLLIIVGLILFDRIWYN